MQTINVIVAGLGAVFAGIGRAISTSWRPVLAGLPLPMLALAASYGVYSFALLFVPMWVAIVQAAAFELTYLGLAVLVSLGEHQRKRARAISLGAVLASIIYNTLAGWFHQRPELIASATDVAWLMLAILHGMPLAWVAYLVSDLLLHRGQSEGAPATRPLWGGPVIVATHAREAEPQPVYPAPVAVRAPLASDAANRPAPAAAPTEPPVVNADGVRGNSSNARAARDYACKHCGAQGLTKAEQLAHGRRRKQHGACS